MSTHTGQEGEPVALQPGPATTLNIQPIKTDDEAEAGYTIAFPSSELFLTLPDGNASRVIVTKDASDKSSWWSIEEAPNSTLPNTFTIRSYSTDDCYLTAQAPFPGSSVVPSTTSFPWAIQQAK
ncbi:hypothetical protein GFY24_33545 [Nocardia sp. SYP-A9097]|uniref:hypothetical protein n=1 Tax=Nocardia sp. SYP-A9097 TaxID=2663237 RepID=UPI00129B40F9|nr:hypothetical protein [Nocardia sp. SYP-A9097]MRH92304.1 hypothetical protein [Nocardia sp. SYP-A9097]